MSSVIIYTLKAKNGAIGKFKGVRQVILLYDNASNKYCYGLYVSSTADMLGFEINDELPEKYQNLNHLDYMYGLYDQLNLKNTPSVPSSFENIPALVQKIYLN